MEFVVETVFLLSGKNSSVGFRREEIFAETKKIWQENYCDKILKNIIFPLNLLHFEKTDKWPQILRHLSAT